MNNFWNERYAEKVFAYGIEPNQFYKEQLAKLSQGNILFAAEGEGRPGCDHEAGREPRRRRARRHGALAAWRGSRGAGAGARARAGSRARPRRARARPRARPRRARPRRSRGAAARG